jgi:hypothetical protein
VNSFDKLKELTSQEDSSPELKKGEIKQILIRTANEILPDFGFHLYKKGCYTFKRIKNLNDWTISETLNILFSIKDNNISCSIASLLNPEYIFSNQYSSGFINSHQDLKVLRHKSGTLKIQDAYYFTNGQVQTTSIVIEEIFNDFKIFGLPFLENKFEILRSSPIIKYGFDYINKLLTNKDDLKKEILEELNKSGCIISSIKHPVFLDLKDKLQSIGGQSREDRQKIPKTVLEFLELYWTK